MARIRTFKPEFWTDSKTGTLSGVATKLFMGMWNHCDDYGVITFDPMEFRAKILPYEVGSIEEVVLRPLTTELLKRELVSMFLYSPTDAGIIQEYSENVPADFKQYIYISNFLKHQRVDKPGEPLIPGWRKGETLEQFLRRSFPNISQENQYLREHSPALNIPVTESSKNVPRTLLPERKGKERKGRERAISPTPLAKTANEASPEQTAISPEGEVLERDEMVARLIALHPRDEAPGLTEHAVVEALGRENSRLGGLQAAFEYLHERTKLYAELTAQWPEDEKQFIATADKFFSGSRYKADERLWVRQQEASPASVGMNRGAGLVQPELTLADENVEWLAGKSDEIVAEQIGPETKKNQSVWQQIREYRKALHDTKAVSA